MTDLKETKNLTGTQITMQICANPEYLSAARMAVRRVAHVAGFEEDDCDSIILAVEEALTNVIRHSYGGPCEKPIILTLNIIGDQKKAALEIVIRDFGKQVDPEAIKGRDLDDIKPGGLGVHIIHSIMDEVDFARADGDGMLLKMLKYSS